MAKEAAKKKKNEPVDFAALRRELKAEGPARAYLLYGEEDYLREAFFDEIKSVCIGEDTSGFNYHKLEGESVSMTALSESVNALPFFADRSLVELRNFDINKCVGSQAEELKAILEDIPDYCTLAIILPAECEPDGRLGNVKAIRKVGKITNFTRQGNSALVNWIIRRFSALGKQISRADAERLIFVSGSLMNRLIPEIEKVANYASGDVVTNADIEAVAHHLPEARVFEMTDKLSRRDYDGAVKILAELLQMKDEPPIKILAVVGKQIRNLYAARVAIDDRLGKSFVMETCGIKMDFVAEKLLTSARGFSTARLVEAMRLCAETDYRMKSSGEDASELMRQLMLSLAAGEAA
jgi:DNA polymerase-3 subunit delta